MSRLFELTTRLFTERIELARGELQETARVTSRRAVILLAGGLLCAVGLIFLGASAVEALGALVHNRGLRLLIVAVPFVAVGVGLVSHVLAGAAADHRDH